MGLDGGQIEQIQGPPDRRHGVERSFPSLPLPGRRSRSSSSPRTSTSSSSKSKAWGRKMTVGAGIAVQEDGSLVALGATVLMEVRGNVLVTPAAGGGMLNGAFLGVRSAPACSRSVFPVEKLSPCATRWTSMSRAGPLSRKASCRTWRTCPSEGPMKLVGQCQMCSHVLNNVM